MNSLHYLSFALPGMFIYSVIPFYIASSLDAKYTIEYGLIQQIANGVMVVSSIATTLYMPKIAHSYVQNKSEARGLLMKNSVFVCAKASVILIGVYLNIDLIIRVWTGKNIKLDNLFLIIYFLAIWFEIMQTTLASASLSSGFNKFGPVTIASAILVTLTIHPSIYQFGFVGVALSVFVCQLVTCHFFNIRKTLQIYNLTLLKYLQAIRRPMFFFYFFILIIIALQQSRFSSYQYMLNIVFVPLALILIADLFKNHERTL
jgi:O-antigen/teichoic acid export membrane protein